MLVSVRVKWRNGVRLLPLLLLLLLKSKPKTRLKPKSKPLLPSSSPPPVSVVWAVVFVVRE